MTAETFSPGTKGIITNLVKLIRREQVEMLLPWWTTSTWSTLLRYPYIHITSESAVSRKNFSVLLLPYFYEIHIFGFPCCGTFEDISIDVSITNVGLILTKLWWFLFSGYGQTRFWNPHMEKCRHTKNFNSKLKISG